MTYCDPSEVREVGAQITATSSPIPATDVLLRTLIERASRYIDLVCGVEPEHFNPALYPVWKSNHDYVVGDIITPTTRNSHKYRVTTAGTSGGTEPTFPTSPGGTVGTAPVFTEYGADVVATNKTVYGDGLHYLKLPAYVAGSLSTTLTVPTGYTAPTFIERDGYLLITSTDGSLVPISPTYSRYSYVYPGWYSGVPIVASAIWGFERTPEDIKMAVIEMVINLLRETDPAQLKLVSIDNQPLREVLPPRVKEVCRRYRAKQTTFV